MYMNSALLYMHTRMYLSYAASSSNNRYTGTKRSLLPFRASVCVCVCCKGVEYVCAMSTHSRVSHSWIWS